MKFLLGIIFFILFNNHAIAQCDERQLGWHFYCYAPHKREDEVGIVNETKVAYEELHAIQAKLESLRVLAVMRPSFENVKQYIAFQQEQLERASAFSKQWQHVLWQTPHLDYTVKQPVSTVGLEVFNQRKQDKLVSVLKSLNQDYGIFFFYRSDCKYSEVYSKVLKTFAEYYGITVMAVSMDGKFFEEWPHSVKASGNEEGFDMKNKPVPATFLFNQKKQKVLAVGFGVLSMGELEERILTMIGEARE